MLVAGDLTLLSSVNGRGPYMRNWRPPNQGPKLASAIPLPITMRGDPAMYLPDVMPSKTLLWKRACETVASASKMTPGIGV